MSDYCSALCLLFFCIVRSHRGDATSQSSLRLWGPSRFLRRQRPLRSLRWWAARLQPLEPGQSLRIRRFRRTQRRAEPPEHRGRPLRRFEWVRQLGRIRWFGLGWQLGRIRWFGLGWQLGRFR
ncbi:hypothetical protein GCM10009804_75380 [Kribbella hippodromi]|uniref:Secreted protein n=1 Tax=Kribbella hippodromi TaxID=434347 RepID=A0ABN2EK22_9ACTN